MQKNESALAGVLREIRFHKESFLIGKLDGGASVKGNMVSPQIGMEYHFKGRWERHPRFGATFIFSEYRASYPKELSAIRTYLMENARWIGPEISKKLVSTFGEDTLEVCKTDPEKVSKEIPGITQKRALEISAMLKNNEANEELQLELKRIVVGTRVSKRAVFKAIELYGQQAPEKIRENPYRLIEDIDGIGFLTADEVAQKVGFNTDGRPRIQAGIVHVLKESAFSSGHTCLPLENLVTESRKLLDVVGRMVEDVHFVMDENFIYLKSFYEAERSIAKKLKELASRKAVPGNPQYDGLMEDQVDALGKAVENQIFILTGAPGTGKTYTIKKIIESFPDAKVSLAAPTGKAAKRRYEQSGMRARTIHKLLEPEKNGNGFYFTRNRDNPIDTDILILDEVSMVDTSLMASLMDAVDQDTRLIMVGDTYQLPSVGPGNIFKDLIGSGEIPTTELTIIKRQDEGLIIRNCHRIKSGKDIKLENSSARDFFFLPRDDEESIREAIFELITKRLKESYKADPLRDVQIISPLRERTSLSCKALNKVCQERLNKSPKIEKCHFKTGDKVIQTKNEYDKNIILGDSGSGKTQTHQRIAEFVNVGDCFSGLTGSRTGLVYALVEHKQKGWQVRIGRYPANSRKLLTVDEAQHLAEWDLSTIAKAMEEGFLQIDRVQSRGYESQTRLILIANPKKNQVMDSFSFGCEALATILKPFIIRRIDMAIFANTGDLKDLSFINRMRSRNKKRKITPEMLRAVIYWAWNLKPDRIIFTSEAEEYCLKRAAKLEDKYGYAVEVPLLIRGDARNNLARVSAAFAALLVSADKNFENLIIEQKHVRMAEEFLTLLYSHDNCALDDYSQIMRAGSELLDYDEIKKAFLKKCEREKYAGDDEAHFRKMISILRVTKVIRRDDLAEQAGSSIETVKRAVQLLKRYNLIETTRHGYVKKPKFNRFLRRFIREHQEFFDGIPWGSGCFSFENEDLDAI